MDILLIGLIIAIVVYLIFTYNGLVKARQMAKEAWSGIDIQLKRRANLIPNLVETVKGYATHEMETFTWVTELRANAERVDDGDVAGRAKSEALLGDALIKLMAVAEAYPELKANQNFLDLQDELSTIEGEIQMSRRYYNGAARSLNVKVESFPSNLIANNFGFDQADYFEIENPADRAVPSVKF
ncbi:MAG: LemA family protein [Hyphomicrobiales bacterium]